MLDLDDELSQMRRTGLSQDENKKIMTTEEHLSSVQIIVKI